MIMRFSVNENKEAMIFVSRERREKEREKKLAKEIEKEKEKQAKKVL